MGVVAVFGLALASLAGLAGLMRVLYAATSPEEEAPPTPPEEEEEEEVIDATLRSGYVWWATLTEWERVHTRWPNEWPADTDITFAWTIKNTGNVGAYFQGYMLSPGEWLYIEPDNEIEVNEEFHTPAVPITRYEYYRITILGRTLSGERVGAVWTSDEIEVAYV